LQNPIFHAHSKFGKHILIGGGYAFEAKFEKNPGGGILLPVLKLTVFSAPLYVSPRKIAAISDNRRPSYSFFILEASVHRPFYTLRNPILHAHTKFGENNLIGVEICPKTKLETLLSG